MKGLDADEIGVDAVVPKDRGMSVLGDGVTILYAGNITTKQAGSLFDVALG
jgi:hypothetical protein